MADERGPNVNQEDLVPSVRDDPMFSSWRDPVPPEWYSANQRTYVLVDQDALRGSLSFARYISRSVSETVTSASDTVVRTIAYARAISEVIDPPIVSTGGRASSASAIGVSRIGSDSMG